MDEELHALEEEFCPPLDPALVHALYPDYAGQEGGTAVLKSLLEDLKQTAIIEQLTDFVPSGSSGSAARSSPSKQSDEVESNAETWTSQTTVTDYTSLSNDLATLGFGASLPSSDASTGEGRVRDPGSPEAQAKEQVLAKMFPALRSEFVAYTLKKCRDDLERATDELLNHVYFEDIRRSPEEEVPVARGIDAFSEEHHLPQYGKKGKKRKQKGINLYGVTSASNSESELSPTVPIANKWMDSGRDVDFLASRTNVAPKTIASLYHANNMSLPGTITAMMKKTIATHVKEEPEASIIQPALKLNDEFPNIELEYANALIRLTAPSTAKAHELAKRLTYPSTASVAGGLQVIPRYAPFNLSEPTPDTFKLPELPPSANPRTAASLSADRGTAFSQASAAYRKGRSNPLFKAAAGYYAQVGRDTNAHLHAQNEADADLFVAQQSSAKVLDLHGVTVDNATRIARLRTKVWWESLGELRIPGYKGGRGVIEPFRIVTGLGRHSEGGRAKIGPAVFRALRQDGWKVEAESGEVFVTGRVRKV
ncbi:hypothetical protein BU23DRAFT_220684 [Bimuria novae-zelandiae CBS 107.79]|uniref:Smr domain-containing protein n=1 Tax=Bimuria novae-zelandiae CBS 107.79 TaxID=1447943 RepID=A0A6A5V073_9PLEO|nr:hypothetical protein BU23DRAFT_220684 [Bimuria novae-zelandiae CBS 107.79]